MEIKYKILRQDMKSFDLGKGPWNIILSDLNIHHFENTVLDVELLVADIYVYFEDFEYAQELTNKIVNFISCNPVKLVNDTNWDWEVVKEYKEVGSRYTDESYC